MIAARYGSIPIVHHTGGLHDTVELLHPTEGIGNGFVFEVPDSEGLRWAIGESMQFYNEAEPLRSANITRIMRESQTAFHPKRTVNSYLKIYETLAGVAI